MAIKLILLLFLIRNIFCDTFSYFEVLNGFQCIDQGLLFSFNALTVFQCLTSCYLSRENGCGGVFYKESTQHCYVCRSMHNSYLVTMEGTAAWKVPVPVAFSLGQDTNVTVNDAIPFSKVITLYNTRDSVHNGVFTCTVPGLYKFQAYSLVPKDKTMFLELYKNSELVASLWGYMPAAYIASGNAAILDLQNGDLVQVKSQNQNTVDVFGEATDVYTTLTGLRLRSPHNVESGETLASFSVSLTQDQHVQGGKSVKYDKVLVDTTNGYDVNTGVFTAPTDGIYLFHFFSCTTSYGLLWQELYRNEQYICAIYAYTNGYHGDAGNTAILNLSAHDQVAIKAKSGSANDLYGRTDQIYSTFSGTQLMTETDLAETANNHGHAFSVGLTSGYTVPEGEKVVFDRIFLDLSLAYNKLTGEFVVPVSGLYEFTYHILGERNNHNWFELHHNNYVNSMYSHTPSYFASGGNAAVIDVDKNDVVYVKSRRANIVFGETDEIYCTFSGYLLKPRD